MGFREIKVSPNMLKWVDKTVQVYQPWKNSAEEIQSDGSVRAGFTAEICHWKWTKNKYDSTFGHDFIGKNNYRLEIGSSQIAIDPNTMPLENYRFMMTNSKHDRLMLSDFLLWYVVSYDYKRAWFIGYASSKLIHRVAYKVEQGKPGHRPGFTYPFTGMEFHATHLQGEKNDRSSIKATVTATAEVQA